MIRLPSIFTLAIFALGSILTITASAQLVPVADMTKIIPGTNVQPVVQIEDEPLKLWENSLLPIGTVMNLPGWSNSTLQMPIESVLIKSFAVRTPPAQQPGTGLFHVSVGVGRSGILEKNARGDSFAVINGIPMKGLTIKGYGGNTVLPALAARQQPGGSLTLSEAYRDALLSSVLLDANIDTYVGVLSIGRQGTNANYIRLSRTALRMNDLVDRDGDGVKAVVDHLTTLLQDEIGHKMSPQEFGDWLVAHTAQVLARKEHLGYRHGSQDDSNIGIAELVDHGEGGYEPFSYNAQTSETQLLNFRQFTLQAAKKVAAAYGLTENYEARFDDSYNNELKTLVERDNARLVLDTATRAQLRDVGLSAEGVAVVQRAQSSAYGVLGLDEMMNSPMISASDRAIFHDKTTTKLQKMPNGSSMPTVLIRELGGTPALRRMVLLASRRALAAGVDFSKQDDLEKLVDQAIRDTLIADGRKAVVEFASASNSWSKMGSFPIENIAKSLALLIAADNATGLTRINYEIKGGGRLFCQEMFTPAM